MPDPDDLVRPDLLDRTSHLFSQNDRSDSIANGRIPVIRVIEAAVRYNMRLYVV